MLRRRLLRKHR